MALRTDLFVKGYHNLLLDQPGIHLICQVFLLSDMDETPWWMGLDGIGWLSLNGVSYRAPDDNADDNDNDNSNGNILTQ